MPRRTDLQRILLIGAGPIVIGQACEFDYSGTQGAKALREEGYEVVLVNSNPATIMTDPELAARTYVEPLEWRTRRGDHRARAPAGHPADARRADGAQPRARSSTRRGCSSASASRCSAPRPTSIAKAEDRALFKAAMEKIGLDVPARRASRTRSKRRGPSSDGHGLPRHPAPVASRSAARAAASPTTRASSTTKVAWALAQSPTHEVLIEESVLGWKEFELEVMRDRADNFIVVCSIENIDPMGVHTGDSITVAPAMTLTDREYQRLRDAARAVMTEIGVETGGANVQFAVDPKDGRVHVIEMNPRVSRIVARSRQKATGLPHREDRRQARRRLHARRAQERHHADERRVRAGHRLRRREVAALRVREVPRRRHDARHADEERRRGDEHRRARSARRSRRRRARSRPGKRRPRVAARPRRLPRARRAEAAARPRRWRRPSSRRRATLPPATADETRRALEKLVATPTRRPALLRGRRDARRASPTRSSTRSRRSTRGFSRTIRRIVDAEEQLRSAARPGPTRLRAYKRLGFSDRQIATLDGRRARTTCARCAARRARAPSTRASTPAPPSSSRTRRTSTRRTRPRARRAPTPTRRKVVILGGGPNRIGQGIEFDYCCVHAVQALRELGFETIMVNCNPETVSTDYDTSRPPLLRAAHARGRARHRATKRSPRASSCSSAGRRRSSSRCRSRSAACGSSARAPTPSIAPRTAGASTSCSPSSRSSGRAAASRTRRRARRSRSPSASAIPVLVRPSYVLGGRAMMIAYTRERARASSCTRAFEAAREAGHADHPRRRVPEGRDRGRRRLRRRRQARASSAA